MGLPAIKGEPRCPVLDAPDGDTIMFHVVEKDALHAIQGDPSDCAIAKAAKRAGLEAMVVRRIVYVKRPATRELLAYSKKQRPKAVKGIKVGDEVLWRYVSDGPTYQAIRAFDEGEGFPDQFVTLRAPTGVMILGRHDKRSESRKERNDARRDGNPVPVEKQKVARQVNLERWRLATT